MSYHSGNQLVDPYVVFEKAQLHPGMHVADFGCGRTGHMVFPAALVVGEQGLVYGVDILKDCLENVQKRAAMESLHQVQTIWSNVEYVGKTAIPAGSLDTIFIVNMLNQSDNRHGILEEARRLLKDKGRIVIVDWVTAALSFSPAEERLVDFKDLVSWARMHGFGLQEECGIGSYHNCVVLYRHN